ncbi:MAG: hypothetical protein ACRDT6_23485 [Micromonosporaceae bacterium]
MSTTTIKVPVELRDRLAERARRDHLTLAEEIARSLDIADDVAFWDAVRSTMGTAEAGEATARDARTFEGALTDGLDPDEDWNDVL